MVGPRNATKGAVAIIKNLKKNSCQLCPQRSPLLPPPKCYQTRPHATLHLTSFSAVGKVHICVQDSSKALPCWDQEAAGAPAQSLQRRASFICLPT